MTWTRVCVVCIRHPHDDDTECDHRCRVVELEDGHVCDRCAARLRRSLAALPEIAAHALAAVAPGVGSGALGTGDPRRAPIDLDAADPTGLLVRLEPADPSTEVTILEALEGWERVVREDRGLSAFGPASLARSILRHDVGRPGQVTLTGTCGFLATQLDWITTEPEFDVRGFAELVARCRAALSRWDADASDRGGWRVPCPTTTDAGECGRILVVRDIGEGADVVWCRGCGRGWEPRRLVLVAGRDAQVWADPEAAAAWANVTRRTLERWAKAGRVRREHGRYFMPDVRDAIDEEVRGA